MKTKLLSLLLTVMLYTSVTNAQTTTWDFGNDTATWPMSAGIGTDPIIVANLGLYPIPTNTNFGAITANTVNAGSFADDFTATQRFQMNGAGYPTGPFQAMPTQRYLFMDVSGACTVKVWFKTGSNGQVRTIYVSNGTAAVGSATTNSGSNLDFAIVTANYTGGAGRLYVYGDAANNLYKVTVTGATVNTTLSSSEFQTSTVNVFSNGKQVNVTNVASATEVNVYSITGALVRTVNTDADVVINDLRAGFYIVNVKSAEGQKSVKVVVK